MLCGAAYDDGHACYQALQVHLALGVADTAGQGDFVFSYDSSCDEHRHNFAFP